MPFSARIGLENRKCWFFFSKVKERESKREFVECREFKELLRSDDEIDGFDDDVFGAIYVIVSSFYCESTALRYLVYAHRVSKLIKG